MGGTLIGAIRHQAFIPWDSDMDIGMTRADWRYFVSAIKNNGRYMIETKFKGGRYLYCLHYDVGVPSNPKIDIFVFDYYEGTHEEAMHKNAQIRKEFKEQFVCDMADKSIVDAIQEFADSCNLTKGQWLCWGMENIESHATDPRWVKRVDDILPTSKLALYGRLFSVPANFIKFVKEEHSDYMDFPPVTICKREGKLMEDYNRHIKANIITE